MQGKGILWHWKFYSWVQKQNKCTQLSGQRKDIYSCWPLVYVRDHGGPKEVLPFFCRWGDRAFDVWVTNLSPHVFNWDCTTGCPTATVSVQASSRHELSVLTKQGTLTASHSDVHRQCLMDVTLQGAKEGDAQPLHCWGLCKDLLISWKRNRKKSGLLLFWRAINFEGPLVLKAQLWFH